MSNIYISILFYVIQLKRMDDINNTFVGIMNYML